MIILITAILFHIAADAKPRCQGFDNYNDKVTIVFTDENVGDRYSVTDVRWTLG